MNKFNVGDKVRILTKNELLELPKMQVLNFTNDIYDSICKNYIVKGMYKYLGKIYTISKVIDADDISNGYYLSDCGFIWEERWLTELTQAELVLFTTPEQQ